MFIYSHNENSEGAKELSKVLNARRIKHEGSAFKGDSRKTVINWGSSTIPDEVRKCNVLNPPELVNRASNKLHFFTDMQAATDGPRIPRFTSSEDTAKAWVRDNNLVVARTILTGHSGAGIRFMSPEEPNSFVSAPLYVEYIKKKHEYRVHFVNKKIVDFQRKALRPGIAPERVDWKVRNLDNGFIYVRGNVELPDDVKLQSEKLIASINLDFGAIDLIWNEKSNLAYVLEVNTAPGVTGTTVENYAKAFKEIS